MRQACECGRCGNGLCDNERGDSPCGKPAVGYVYSMVPAALRVRFGLKKDKRYHLCAACYDSWIRLPGYVAYSVEI